MTHGRIEALIHDLGRFRGRSVRVRFLATAVEIAGEHWEAVYAWNPTGGDDGWWIDEVTLTINRGQRLRPLPEGNRYLGFIFAHAETPAEAEAALRRAHARLRFEIEPL